MARRRKEVDDSTYAGRFAVRLRALREGKGLTVEELAEKTGIPIRTLYTWENCTRSPINEDLPKLAKVLGMKTRNLLPED